MSRFRMIEIFLALVAAFRKGWGYWVLVPLAGSVSMSVGFLLGPEPYRITFLIGYLGALVVLSGMVVRHWRILSDKKLTPLLG